MPGSTLVVRDLAKSFEVEGQSSVAVDGVSFDVASGEFFTMLGPSGCGKTTTLRMIAGLEAVTGGSIEFEGRDYTSYPAQRRNIGMVFQSYALFPHLPIFENVAYGLRLRGLAEAEIDARVKKTLDLLRLGPFARRFPADLSGGQQQRVSIARALVYEPGMLLLDEPLANLDAKLRVHMREEIRRIQRELAITTLYVTHDQEEAMSVSDRIAVFDHGRIRQVGRPQDVYDRPVDLFVADFIGKANFFRGVGDASGAVRIGQATSIAAGFVGALAPADVAVHKLAVDEAIVMVRPERLILARAGEGLEARVVRIQHLGPIVRYSLAAPSALGELTVDAGREVAGMGEGDAGRLSFVPGDARLYVTGGGA
ncbi:MAG: ABC transporter ATP-binding protein [Rhodospirillales bacterium]|nr:ABC transporter ATP-binding protein [Rhodospirillales bacterium]